MNDMMKLRQTILNKVLNLDLYVGSQDFKDLDKKSLEVVDKELTNLILAFAYSRAGGNSNE